MCERVFIFMNTLEYKPLCTIHEYEYKRVCSIHDSEYVFKLLLPQWRHLARAASLGPWAWLCARCVPWDCHWVGEDESYGTDRCIRALERLFRSYETVEPPRDACLRPGRAPEDASTDHPRCHPAIPAVPEKDQELGPWYPIQFLKV